MASVISLQAEKKIVASLCDIEPAQIFFFSFEFRVLGALAPHKQPNLNQAHRRSFHQRIDKESTDCPWAVRARPSSLDTLDVYRVLLIFFSAKPSSTRHPNHKERHVCVCVCVCVLANGQNSKTVQGHAKERA